MPGAELSPEARERILAALEHDQEGRVFADFLQAEVSPDGATALLFYDRWEYHMGAESAKVALATRDGAILRAFPFDANSTVSGFFRAAWQEDSSQVAIDLGGVVLIWSVPASRFALACVTFSVSSVEWVADALLVRESKYRVRKSGGYYADGPAGARFPLAGLRWREATELSELWTIAEREPRRAASKLG